MVATWNPAALAAYYTTSTDYYTEGGEPAGRWFAPTGAFHLVDGTAVDQGDFERLFGGVDLGGHSLVDKANRRDRIPAYDMTFSAPRSVAIAWALAAPELREALEGAQDRASCAAVEMLSDEAVFARRGKGGERIERVGLTAALFRHGDSRPAEHADGATFGDPNLHTHSVILNLAARADGSVGAIHSTVLRDYKMAAGAIYHAALAAELNSLGFDIDRIGTNGTFEIAGIDDNVIRYFSARRQEIEDELKAAGTTSATAPALAASIAKSTRSAKKDQARETRNSVWQEAASAFQIRPGFSESLCGEAPRHIPNAVLSEQRLEAVLREATEMESVLRRQDLIRAVAASAVGTGASHAAAVAAVDSMLANGRVVEIGTDAIGLPLYSTPHVIDVEASIVEAASRMATRENLALDSRNVMSLCEHDGLSAEQTQAAIALTSRCDIAIVEGSAGTGKTTTLRPVSDSYREAGYRVLGAAAAWKTATDLGRDLDIESWSIASVLAKVQKGKLRLDNHTVLIVDEAGLLGSRDMLSMIQAVDEAGAKLVLTGDRRQLQPIGAGPALAIVAEVVETARVDTIVRQREEWAREAVSDFRDGKADEALAAFAAKGTIIDVEGGKAAVGAAVDEWERVGPSASRLIVAKSNRQVGALSAEVRARLKRDGFLRGDDVDVQAVTPSGHPTTVSLANGDSVRFLKRNDALGVINGTTAVIDRIEAQPITGIRIEASIGSRKIVFRPEDIADDKGRALLGWAYATTLYGAQGATVDHATALVDSTWNRHDAYVAASRARQETHFVIDGAAIDKEVRSAGSTTGANPDEKRETRLMWLAKRLSRESRKISTVEVIAARTASRKAVGSGADGRKVQPIEDLGPEI